LFKITKYLRTNLKNFNQRAALREEVKKARNNYANLAKDLANFKNTALISLVQFKDSKELKNCVNGLKNGCKALEKKVVDYKTLNNNAFKLLEDNSDSLNNRIINAGAFTPKPNLVNSMIRVLEVGDIVTTAAFGTLISRGPHN